jgi:hypothetical protein
MLTLEITDRAEADIEEIYLYIALESYQSYAESFGYRKDSVRGRRQVLPHG